MNVRKFHLIGKSDIEALGHSIAPILQGLAKIWFRRNVTVATVETSSYTDIAEFMSNESGIMSYEYNGWLSIHLDDDTKLQILKAIIPEESIEISHSIFTSKAAMKIIDELVNDFAIKIITKNADIDINELTIINGHYSNDLPSGSGAVLIKILINEEINIPVLLSHRVVERYIDNSKNANKVSKTIPKQALSDRKNALGNQNIRMNIMLGSADLEIGSVLSLSEGDVIKLDKKIDEPCKLVIGDKGLSYTGYLGKQSNKIAFQLKQLNNS